MMFGEFAAKRRQMEEAEAAKYAELIRTVGVDWTAVNADIVRRFSRTALLRIKRRAWAIVEGKA